MLYINNLHIRRGMFEISLPKLSLQAGEVVAIRGASGSGKSTLLEMLGLILKPDGLDCYRLGSGEEQRDITTEVLNQASTLARLRAEYFGFMLQTGGLLPYLIVQQNIRLSCDILGKKVDENWLAQIIEQLNIGHLLNHYPKQLSIGERQRVSFIRSIAHHPAVLLADEPTAALDPHNAEKLFDIIVDLVRQNNLSALIVTHDWTLAQVRKIPSICAELMPQRAVFSRQEE